MNELVKQAAAKGFKTVAYKDGGLWIVAFTREGKWSPPYSGFTLEEAVAEAGEDMANVKGAK